MNLIQCTNAYAALQPLMEMEWDYKTAYGLMMLKRKLQPHAAFFSQKEMELAGEYAQKDEKGKIVMQGVGRFVFRDPALREEYTAKRAELGAVTIEDEITPMNVPAPKAIKPVLIEALEGFVAFGEEGTA